MSSHWKDYWQELHHGEQEYCRASGPLNSRKINAAKAKNVVASSGLGLVASAAAAVGLAVAVAALYITSAPVTVGNDSAVVNVNILNREVDEQIEYVLTKEDEPDVPLDSGVVEEDKDTLEFDGLENNTTYVIEYFSDRDGTREKVGEFRFTTDGPVQEGSSPPVGTDPPPESSEEIPIPPETTESEEETREQYEETTESEEETTEESTEESIVETTSEEETTTTQKETESETTVPVTRPDEPTSPSESDTEESTTAPETADPSQDIQVSAEVVSATPTPTDGWMAEGYICTERHTFTNVSSGDAVITAMQDGQEVTYQMSYNSGDRTMTIEFMGNEIPAGQSATSTVTVEDVDGRSATSSLTITAPSLNSLTLTVEPNGDGTYTFTISGNVTQPSHGSLLYTTWITDGMQDGVEEDFTGAGSTYTHSIVMTVNAVGELYAYADLYGRWSLQGNDSEPLLYIGAVGEVRYEAGAGSSLEFVLKKDTSMDNSGVENQYTRYPYEYDVTATFAGLGDITPISMEFIRTRYTRSDNVYEPVYPDMPNESVMTVNDLIVGEDGAIRATYEMPEQGTGTMEGVPESMYVWHRHEWSVILTYQDSAGVEHTVQMNDYIEPMDYTGIFADGAIRRLPDGSYLAEVDLRVPVTYMNPGHPILDYVTVQSEDQQPLNDGRMTITEWSTEEGMLLIKGTVPMEAFHSLMLDVYAYWSESDIYNSFNTGVGVVFAEPSHSFNTLPVTDDAGNVVGYEVEENFIFIGLSQEEYNTFSFTIPDQSNIRDLTTTYDSDTGEAVVSFVRTNLQLEDEVTSEISVTYKRTGAYDETRSISTYEKYTVFEA